MQGQVDSHALLKTSAKYFFFPSSEHIRGQIHSSCKKTKSLDTSFYKVRIHPTYGGWVMWRQWTLKNKHGQWQGNSFHYKMQRLKKSVVSWATNQSQLSMEEGCISWPLFLKWLGSVEKVIFLSRDIALLRWKLQKERSSESDEWPGHSRCSVHSARGAGGCLEKQMDSKCSKEIILITVTVFSG